MNLKTFALLMSILSYMCHATPNQKVEDKTNSSVSASLHSVACFGRVAGKCKENDGFLSYEDFVSKHLGKPAKVEAVHYFENRDDKVILEYSDVETNFSDVFIQVTLSLYMNNLYPKTFGPMESFLAERRLFLEKNCPIKNGCINARNYLDALEKGLDK
ncbi:hypothetical protein OKZ62_001845 [Vibrio navarrensis]|nr:hypothetical protein [Vibrio navarrensis]